MKFLPIDLARTATITSLYETLTYPAQNLSHVFLDKLFVSALDTDTVTVDLGADTPISAIYVAGCNAPSVSVLAKNAALSTVWASVSKATSTDVVSFYHAEVSARYIEITGDASSVSAYLKIKGIGVGLAYECRVIASRFALPVANESRMSRSPYGQSLVNRAPTLKKRDISIEVVYGNRTDLRSDTYELLDKLADVGIGYPTYWDLTENNSTFEAPIYAKIPDVWSPIDTGSSYRVQLSLLECR